MITFKTFFSLKHLLVFYQLRKRAYDCYIYIYIYIYIFSNRIVHDLRKKINYLTYDIIARIILIS